MDDSGQLFDGMLSDKQCDEYWEEAVRLGSRNPFGSNIRNADRIKIDNSYCYNRNKYSSKGWCELAEDSRKWGVCSPMCRPDFIEVQIIKTHFDICTKYRLPFNIPFFGISCEI